MDLTKNPFAILDLSPRDGKDKIVEQVEDKLASSEHDEVVLLSAQNALMASKSRLDAEIHWVPEISPKLAKELLQLLVNNSSSVLNHLDTLEGLSQANIAANLCFLKIANHRVLEAICKSYAHITPESIQNIINQSRAIAQFPSVDLSLVEQSLQKLRGQHVLSVINSITSSSDPGKSMTELVNAFLNSERSILNFVEQVVESFTNWATGTLRRLEDQIDLEINNVKDSCADKSIEQIIARLKEWDELGQPKQLIWQAKGLEEPKSKELFNKVRSLAIWLANEKQMNLQALMLTQACADIFAELQSAVDKAKEDIETLNDLIEQQKLEEDFKPLLQAIEKAKENTGQVSKEILKGQFSKNGKGVAGNIFNGFIEAKKCSDGSPRPDLPWLILRNFCLFLHNDKDKFEASYIIAKEVDKFNPPESIKILLVKDLAIFRKNKLWKEINQAMKSKPQRLNRAASLSQQLLSITTDQEEKNSISVLYSRIVDDKKQRRKDWAIGLLVFGAIVYWIANSSNDTRVSTTNSNVSAPDNGNEVEPPIGKGHTLSRGELRYCEFMGARLDYIMSLFPTDKNPDALQSRNAKFLSKDLADGLDKAINDFNGRCSEAKYYTQDMSDIKSELNRKRAGIVEQIKSVLSKENKQIIFR